MNQPTSILMKSKAGYKVRGTVRDPDKASWMKDRFEQYGKSNFELVAVDDMAADGAFDDAVKGIRTSS